MNLSQLEQLIQSSGFSKNVPDETYPGVYSVNTRDNLKSAIDGNRQQTGWKKANVVVVKLKDGNSNITLTECLDGWKAVASSYDNQLLILETKKDEFHCFDSKGNEIEGDIQEIIDAYNLNKNVANILADSSDIDPDSNMELYRKFIALCTTSPASVNNYSDFARINLLLKILHPEFDSLINCTNPQTVSNWLDELLKMKSDDIPDTVKGPKDKKNNNAFKQLGGSQYYNAVLTYIRYLNARSLLSKVITTKDDKSIAIDNQKQMVSSNKPLQLIYFGAPGTSKSTTIERDTNGKKKYRVTFHPDTDYASFVGCYKPKSNNKSLLDGRGLSKDEIIDIFEQSANFTKQNKARFMYEILVNKADIDKVGLNASQIDEELNKRNFGNCTYSGGEYNIMQYIYNWLRNEGYLKSNSISYEFVPQTFTKAYVEAWKRLASDAADKEVYLVIEEINRGNCAQIFGDLFQLLDRKVDGYSDYEIIPDSDLQDHLKRELSGLNLPNRIKNGEVMILPPNLFIWATMNTSDQSLFPIDSAFKRRWDWRYLPIKNEKKEHKIQIRNKQYDWWTFLEKINDRIEKMTMSEDKKLGYWFCQAKDGVIDVEKFVCKVVFYLWNDVFKDFPNDANSPFTIKEGDDKKEYLKFHSFFDKDGNVDVDKARKFIEGLGVDGKSTEDEKPADDEPKPVDVADDAALPEPVDDEKTDDESVDSQDSSDDEYAKEDEEDDDQDGDEAEDEDEDEDGGILNELFDDDKE